MSTTAEEVLEAPEPEKIEEKEEEQEKKPFEKLGEQVDALEPMAKIPPRVQHLRYGDVQRDYVQKPLAFFGKMRFLQVMGEALDRAMSGEDGLTFAALLGGGPEGDRVLSPDGTVRFEAIKDVDVFIRAVAKLTAYAPELLQDVYVIALGVPRSEELWAKAAMDQHEDDGGLSDEDGIAILETFVGQNGEVLRSFFVDRILPMFEKWTSRQRTSQQSSKPSRATRRSTQKRSKSS